MQPFSKNFLFIFLTALFVLTTIVLGFLWMQARNELRIANQEVRNLEEQFKILERKLIDESRSTNYELRSEVTEVNTTSWKAYRNEEYGFIFKYPQDWVVQENKVYPHYSVLLRSAVVRDLNRASIMDIHPVGPGVGSIFRIYKNDENAIGNIKFAGKRAKLFER